MTAQKFYEKFTKKMYETNGVINTYWNSCYSEFTELVVSKVIDKTIEEEFKLSHEYFRIDASGWTSKSNTLKHIGFGLNPHLWDLEIAVEHENNWRDWSDEVIKLMHIRCPLKVVIGYNETKSRHDKNSHKSDTNKVRKVMEWMSKTNAFQQMPNDEEFLIILGNAGNRTENLKKEVKKSIDYRGYLIKKGNGKLSIAETYPSQSKA